MRAFYIGRSNEKNKKDFDECFDYSQLPCY